MISGVNGGMNAAFSSNAPALANAAAPVASGQAAANSNAARAGGRGAAPNAGNSTDLMGVPHRQSGQLNQASQGSSSEEQQMIQLLMQLIQLLIQMLSGQDGNSSGASGARVPDGGGTPVNETANDAQNVSGELIPPPTENVQTINLGGKQVTIGSDGSASAAEVQQTASTLQNMYQTSPTFRNQIDNNPNASLEVTVGKRGDNTSWGGADGRIFLNINNVAPTANDSFQALVSHEVAHTQGLDHGAELDGISEAAAAEA